MKIDFINPYNFVPFGTKIEEKRTSREMVYRGQEKLKSGWLDVTLTAKTPIIIPDGAHPEYIDAKTGRRVDKPDRNGKYHKKYSVLKFYDEEGNLSPVIPGSEIRGCLRSIYEAATDSCVPFLMDDKPISQRVPLYGSFQKRGLFTYDPKTRCWKLYSASVKIKEPVNIRVIKDGDNRIIDHKFYSWATGREITELPGSYIQGKGYTQYNVPVNTNTSKQPYYVRYLEPADEIMTWASRDDEPYRELKSALYRDGVKGNQPNSNKKINSVLRRLLEDVKNAGPGQAKYVPVFYIKTIRDGKPLFYMSCSAIGRIGQHRKWKDIMGSHTPCSSTDKLCPACLMFGTTNGNGLKSRIRITDAFSDSEVKTKKYMLGILGEPRTSSFEFYLRRPRKDATYWNFDFYGVTVKNEKTGAEVTEYHDLKEATPRGRKMYWHGPIVNDEGRMTHLNSTMEAYCENSEFKFRIYFDEITQKQLTDLIWIITLGENKADSKMCHKIGHARPYGYGSAKMVITSGFVREVSEKEDSLFYDLKPIDELNRNICPTFDMKSDAMKALVRMVNMDSAKGGKIMYPRQLKVKKNRPESEGKDDIFLWFADNRMNSGKVKTLPEPNDADITLKGSVKENN